MKIFLIISSKFLDLNCGAEFTFNAFNEFFSNHGITHQLSCSHAPQQNEVAERKHRHLVVCAFSLKMTCHLLGICYFYCCASHKQTIYSFTPYNLSPWELLFQAKLDLLHLKVLCVLVFLFLSHIIPTNFNLTLLLVYF